MLMYKAFVEGITRVHPLLSELIGLNKLDPEQWLIFPKIAKAKFSPTMRDYVLDGDHYCSVTERGISFHSLWVAPQPGLTAWLRSLTLINDKTGPVVLGLSGMYESSKKNFVVQDIGVIVPVKFHPQKNRGTLFSPTEGKMEEKHVGKQKQAEMIFSIIIQQRLTIDQAVMTGAAGANALIPVFYNAVPNKRVHILSDLPALAVAANVDNKPNKPFKPFFRPPGIK